jgi:hypothetical protein
MARCVPKEETKVTLYVVPFNTTYLMTVLFDRGCFDRMKASKVSLLLFYDFILALAKVK